MRAGQVTCRIVAAVCLAGGGAGAEPERPAELLFTIGMHIEPLGVTEQGFRGGSQGDYRQPLLFERHAGDIRQVAAIVERHGGRMTIQAQSPFTTAALERGERVLAELAARGHEIALHFHEDAHLGAQSSQQTAARWCAVLKEEIELVRKASGVNRVRYWSGGNLYPDLLAAAACAGLEVNSDWKDPRTQTTPLELVGVNPWRPAGGVEGEGSNLQRFARHDPSGAVIFLPEGQYDRTDFAASRRSQTAGGDAAYFEYLKKALAASLEAARPDRVNVFHFTIHPGEFRGDARDPFGVIERFLSEAVDPLAASGRLKWATLGEMADAFAAWERANPGVSPKVFSGAAGPVGTPKRGYMTFAINVHDWTHPEESAATLLRLVELFERHQVRGDFYFTPEITRVLASRRPEVIERLKRSRMTVSYHVRPPHPLVEGFDSSLRGLDETALQRLLTDSQTFGLDLRTGELMPDQSGGYRYVSQAFGRDPVAVGIPNADARIRSMAERVFAWLGARMTIHYHEEGTRIEAPFEFSNELLVRPSDFSITRVKMPDGRENFWWNLAGAGGYHPVDLLKSNLQQWEAKETGRRPFVTALIHENNFYRSGPEGWTSIYYEIVNGQRGRPLKPPFDLNAPDPSRPRPEAGQQAIWEAYEALVAYAAQELAVVTSEDIVKLARSGLGFDASKAGSVQRDVVYCSPGGEAQRMDLYYPEAVGGRWPALVYVHGGGWTSGDKAASGRTALEIEALRRAGFLVASVNYRLGPAHRFPAMIEDVKCAVRSLRAKAAEYNLDERRIGVWGTSAGGHLAALLGTADASAGFDVGEHREQSSRVQAVVSMYGPADFSVRFAGDDESKPEVFWGIDARVSSPVGYVSPDDPPFLLIHGEMDSLVPISQSEILLERLREAGVPAELVRVKNAQHGLAPAGTGPVDPAPEKIAGMLVEFFRKWLRD